MTLPIRVIVALFAVALVGAAAWYVPADNHAAETEPAPRRADVDTVAPAAPSRANPPRSASRARPEAPAAPSDAPRPRNATVSFRLRASADRHPATVKVTTMTFTALGAADLAFERAWSEEPVRIEVPSGRVYVTVRAPGFVRVSRQVEVTSANETSLGEVVLEEGFVLEGRVVDASDRPIARAQVKIERGDSTSADSTGAFRFEEQPTGSVDLRVSADGYAAEERRTEIAAAAPPLTVTLYREATIRGVVRDAAGTLVPKQRIVLRAEGADHPAFIFATDETASFAERVRPGRWHVVVCGDEAEEIGARDVDVAEGADVLVDLRVTK